MGNNSKRTGKRAWFGYRDTRGLVRMPLPETDAEFAIVTQAYFGKSLHIRSLSCGSYEIDEPYKVFGKCSDYDTPEALWNWLFGKLCCGGVARSSYGQFTPRGHRHVARLNRWISNRRNGETYTRMPFQRLAARIGEQRKQSDSR